MHKVLGTYRHHFLVGGLVVLTLAVFWQVTGHEFINYDDDDYVTGNRYVRQGLTLQGVLWAFKTFHESNWHPLTWLSHMLDYELFGQHAIGHHAISLLIHLANVLVLYWLLYVLTGYVWRSAFVAALFAIHPLHVESVAWIAERKDVLSTLFALLSILAYVHYVRSSIKGYYGLAIVLLALGLMAKPMVVTLPVVLLLLDYWPLRRYEISGSGVRFRALVAEKLPFIVLSVASSVVTYVAQSAGQSVGSLERFPLSARLANACLSYVAYIWKTIVPTRLAVFYPHPGASIPVWKVVASFIFLAFVTTCAIRVRKRCPFVVVGWMWYMTMLLPVIGFVQVGWQAMADRYTYLPFVGLFIVIAWGIPYLFEERIAKRQGVVRRDANLPLSAASVLGVVCCVVILTMAALAWKQVSYWKDSVTLFEHTLRVTKNNAVAHNNLGMAYASMGKVHNAIQEYKKAIEVEPGWADARVNLGTIYLRIGQLEQAESQFRHVLRIAPSHPAAHNNLGALFLQKGNPDEAIRELKAALSAYHEYALAHINLGTALDMVGRREEALRSYFEAVKVDPTEPDAHYNLGLALAERGRTREAVKHYEEALRLRPYWPEAMNNLAWILTTQKNPSYLDVLKAIRLAKKACEIAKERDPVFLDTLAAAYAAADRWEDAVRTATKALKVCRDQESARVIATRLRYYELRRQAPK